MKQRSIEIANQEIGILNRALHPAKVTEENKSRVNEMIWRMEHRIKVTLEKLDEYYKNPKGYEPSIDRLEIRTLMTQEAVNQARKGNWSPLDYLEYPYRESYHVGL